MRLVKAVCSSDFNEFPLRLIVTGERNEDEKGSKELSEKGDSVKCVRMIRGDFVVIQRAWEIEWEGVDMK